MYHRDYNPMEGVSDRTLKLCMVIWTPLFLLSATVCMILALPFMAAFYIWKYGLEKNDVKQA